MQRKLALDATDVGISQLELADFEATESDYLAGRHLFDAADDALPQSGPCRVGRRPCGGSRV
jgi:hypothetical protein